MNVSFSFLTLDWKKNVILTETKAMSTTVVMERIRLSAVFLVRHLQIDGSVYMSIFKEDPKSKPRVNIK